MDTPYTSMPMPLTMTLVMPFTMMIITVFSAGVPAVVTMFFIPLVMLFLPLPIRDMLFVFIHGAVVMWHPHYRLRDIAPIYHTPRAIVFS